MAEFCESPNNQLALELSKNRGWRTSVCFPFSALAHAQATSKNLKTITAGQKYRLYITGFGRKIGAGIVDEISCKSGCKLRQTCLPPHACRLRSAWKCLVSEEQRSSQSDVIQGGLPSVWSYRHGWLTRRLQHATQQIDRPEERPVPLYCLLHAPSEYVSGVVSLLRWPRVSCWVMAEALRSVKIRLSAAVWAWPDVSSLNVSLSCFSVINVSQRACYSVLY